MCANPFFSTDVTFFFFIFLILIYRLCFYAYFLLFCILDEIFSLC